MMKKIFFALNMLLLCAVSALMIPGIISAQEPKDGVYYFNRGKAVLESGEAGKAVEYFKKADALRANHPTIMQYLASACTQAGLKECTFHYLQKLGLIYADLSILQDSVFHRWKGDPSFREIRTFYEQMNEMVTTSDTAFVIPEKDLHPEAVALDKRTGSFYIGSIRKRKIIKRNSDGFFEPFISEGLLAASSMKIDASGSYLWLASPATREMEGFEESNRGELSASRFFGPI